LAARSRGSTTIVVIENHSGDRGIVDHQKYLAADVDLDTRRSTYCQKGKFD
jgi:hypothetical protein